MPRLKGRSMPEWHFLCPSYQCQRQLRLMCPRGSQLGCPVPTRHASPQPSPPLETPRPLPAQWHPLSFPPPLPLHPLLFQQPQYPLSGKSCLRSDPLLSPVPDPAHSRSQGRLLNPQVSPATSLRIDRVRDLLQDHLRSLRVHQPPRSLQVRLAPAQLLNRLASQAVSPVLFRRHNPPTVRLDNLPRVHPPDLLHSRVVSQLSFHPRSPQASPLQCTRRVSRVVSLQGSPRACPARRIHPVDQVHSQLHNLPFYRARSLVCIHRLNHWAGPAANPPPPNQPLGLQASRALNLPRDH